MWKHILKKKFWKTKVTNIFQKDYYEKLFQET